MDGGGLGDYVDSDVFCFSYDETRLRSTKITTVDDLLDHPDLFLHNYCQICNQEWQEVV